MKSQLNLIVFPAVVALSLAAAVSAHAESPNFDDAAAQASATTKTRDQVNAELRQARADGTINAWSSSYYNHRPVAKSLKSRDEVQAEVAAHRAAGYGVFMIGQDDGSFRLTQQKPAREASPVLAKANR